MFNLNVKKSSIYLALKWDFVFKTIKALKFLFFISFISISPLFFYGFFFADFFKRLSDFLLGISIISLVLFLISLIAENFFNFKLKKPKIKTLLLKAIKNPNQYNLAEFLSFETAKTVNRALKFDRLKQISSNHLFYFLLEDNPRLNFIFSRLLLNFKRIKKDLRNYLNDKRHFSNFQPGLSKDFQDVILESLRIARKRKHKKVEIGDMLFALVKINEIFKRILINFNLKNEDIKNLTLWLESIEKEKEKERKFWEYENLAKKGTLAKEWSAAYTINLNKYSKDITRDVKKGINEIKGHKGKIELMERILSRREINNVLIIGKPGAGRMSMVYSLAQKSLLGRSLAEVNYKRIKELNMSSLLAKVQGVDEAEEILDRIFQETASAGNIILVIDNFHNYIAQGVKPGVIDIAGIIAPYLKLPQFQLIAVTTYDGLHRHIEKNPSILSFFEKVEVSEISSEETIIILGNLALSLEKKYKVLISYPALREVISLTGRYMSSSVFPKKPMEILDEVVIYVSSSTRDRIVLPKHVAKVITEKTEIPVGEIETKEKDVLLNLEKLIHQRIINQNEAVKEVSAAMRRARSDITIRKGPMGAFLFLGPTGVGKTETSKALAQVYFGSEKRMVRIDMSEFQDVRDIPRLIGSNDEKGLLTVPVRENPFSLLLLDEIEKAHPNILNLFLQVLDEGYLTDGLGRKVSFKNTIIIATSNAGYKIILRVLKELTGRSPLLVKGPIGKSKQTWDKVKQRLLDYLFENKIFRPEFINRFDAIVVFSPLSKENLLDIAGLMLDKLRKNLKEKGIEFVIAKSLKEKIVELSYNPVFGAREMRRVIQDKVENVLAEALLKNEIKRGDKIQMNSEFKLFVS